MDIFTKKDVAFPNLVAKKDVSIVYAKERGDWKGIKDILLKKPQEITDIVKESGLRGRGGAGFSTGEKWSFIIRDDAVKYIIVNADEGEPGTCKDRAILKYEPHKMIEGTIIAACAIGAKVGYIYIRGEFYDEFRILDSVVKEAYKDGKLGNNIEGSGFSFDLYIHRGAGAYICGEESALIESIEGKRGIPRIKPPSFPAVCGLYGQPTVVNNVETLAILPMIFKRGVKWFKSFGRKNNYGPKVFCISGDVNSPCTVEAPMSIKLEDLIEKAGGVIGGWGNLKAVIPGGSSMPMLSAKICREIMMDFDSLSTIGSGFGTGGIIVINKDRDIIRIMLNLAKFYMKESCGQCTPCREGTGWIWRILKRWENDEGSAEEIELLLSITKHIEGGHTICAFGESVSWPMNGFIKHFRAEIEARLSAKN